jgi:hypothetical protein
MGKQATAIVVYKSYIYMNSTGEKKNQRRVSSVKCGESVGQRLIRRSQIFGDNLRV